MTLVEKNSKGIFMYFRIVFFTDKFAYYGHNPDKQIEKEMGRLKGSGSFYWNSAKSAYKRILQEFKKEPNLRQAKIETISNKNVARLYKHGKDFTGYMYD